jgi:uncharacterized membrane protein YphA (DoxX/SURF4 family)
MILCMLFMLTGFQKLDETETLDVEASGSVWSHPFARQTAGYLEIVGGVLLLGETFPFYVSIILALTLIASTVAQWHSDGESIPAEAFTNLALLGGAFVSTCYTAEASSEADHVTLSLMKEDLLKRLKQAEGRKQAQKKRYTKGNVTFDESTPRPTQTPRSTRAIDTPREERKKKEKLKNMEIKAMKCLLDKSENQVEEAKRRADTASIRAIAAACQRDQMRDQLQKVSMELQKTKIQKEGYVRMLHELTPKNTPRRNVNDEDEEPIGYGALSAVDVAAMNHDSDSSYATDSDDEQTPLAPEDQPKPKFVEETPSPALARIAAEGGRVPTTPSTCRSALPGTPQASPHPVEFDPVVKPKSDPQMDVLEVAESRLEEHFSGGESNYSMNSDDTGR